jgi:hypothetical protein
LGLSLVFASIYFGFFASPQDGGVSAPVDWVIGAWALAMGLGLVKLLGYGETESVGIFAADLLVLAVLAAASRSRG